MKVRPPTIRPHASGLAATHDVACPVCRTNHAVLTMHTGIFQPCWICQSKGYTTLRVPRWAMRLVRRWVPVARR